MFSWIPFWRSGSNVYGGESDDENTQNDEHEVIVLEGAGEVPGASETNYVDQDWSRDQGRAFTQNGAPSYETTGDARLDLFGKVCRDTPIELLHVLLERSWKVDPLDTLRIIFHLRDCRSDATAGGKGEREQFYRAITWLSLARSDVTGPSKFGIDIVGRNLEHIPFYGSYKDYLHFLDVPQIPSFWGIIQKNAAESLRTEMLRLFAAQLRKDLRSIENGKPFEISLAAKYAPTEGCHHDKTYKAVSLFCKQLEVSKESYRKNIIGPLRRQLDQNSILLERHLTNNVSDWESINFSKIPSLALKKYKKALQRHQPERYNEWTRHVSEGTATMNTGRLMPYEMVAPYAISEHGTCPADDTIEAQWISYITNARKNLKAPFRALAVVDTSGSMYSTSGKGPKPIHVALSLGLLIAELTTGPFQGRFFTFSSNPVLQTIGGATLRNKIAGMKTASWGQSTDFNKTFRTLLNEAVENSTPAENMPETIFVFSDMQFDVASGENSVYTSSPLAPRTNFEVLKILYEEKGYTLPRLVFWNLSGSYRDFPVPENGSNVTYVGGFSADILNAILENGNLTPVDLMLRVIRSERYQRITL